MRVGIFATEEQKREITSSKFTNSETDLVFITNISEVTVYAGFDVIFLLNDAIPISTHKNIPGKHIVVNSVVDTLESAHLPSNFSRINGWHGFLSRPVWEIASNNKPEIEIIFKSLGWEISFVKDEPGLVAARVLSMVINEAHFALGENVSTINEIDLAMKSGTNYPLGPFEWENIIGTKNIYLLLKKLSETNRRYLVAPSLEENFKKLTLF